MPDTIELIATGLFVIAVLHTFSTSFFEHLAHVQPAHRGLWHLLGEVEVVFGFWAFILILVMYAMLGPKEAIHYIESRNFTEPAFVFVIMVMAASAPVLALTSRILETAASALPLPAGMAFYVTVLTSAPLLGSLITEPAAMTVAALLLRDRYFRGASPAFQYATLGTLFVNISVGGTLTTFAAPPVLLVAGPWGWDVSYMLANFGWRAVIVTAVNAALVTWLNRSELAQKASQPALPSREARIPAPWVVTVIHLLFILLAVLLLHHPIMFIALFLLFLGFTDAYPRHQQPLILREALLVAFFLAGLVVLGGSQRWWLQPILQDMPPGVLFYGALALTAVTDNAALTYLGSLVDGTTEEFRYALVAGAIGGGGLTVIANAPNPAGVAILKGTFKEGAISALGLARAALLPTLVVIMIFWWLPF